MSIKLAVIGLGAMNLDLFCSVERVVIDGESAVINRARHPGGSAANTIFGLAKLGIRCSFIGTVGADQEGRLLLDSFESAGVETGHIKIKGESPTGTVLAITDTKRHRALYVSPGANNLLEQGDIDLNYLNQASIIHFSSFTSDRLFELQNNILDHLSTPVKLSFAPGALYSAGGFQAVKAMLAKTHTLFINRAELKQLTGQDFKEGASLCLGAGCHQVVVTLGKGLRVAGVKGASVAYIRDKDREYFIPARKGPQDVLDTTGAGDAFAAGFLFGLLKGKDPYQCGLLGDLVASFSLTRLGARDGLPTLEQLMEAYHSTLVLK